MDSLDGLVTLALEVGPSGRFVLPVLGAIVGLLLFGVSFALVSQRVAWRAADLWRAARGSFHGAEVGQTVLVLGRLRAPGGASIPSFERGDRRAVVSSVYQRHGVGLACIATRAAPRLELATRHGALPLEGLLDVRRTRATRRARNVDERALSRASVPATSLRVADLHDGQWVLAAGVVGRVTREGLREQAGVRGLSGTESPIVLTALRPELPRGTIPIAVLGAVALAALLTPLPWAGAQPLIALEHRAPWCVLTAVRLLGPTRAEVIGAMHDSSEDAMQRQWALTAARERGDCAEEVHILAASRRDDEALAVIERCPAQIAPRLRWTLLRETGWPVAALGVTDRTASASERYALELEANVDPALGSSSTRGFRVRRPASGLECALDCQLAIRDAGPSVLERVESERPLRRVGLGCGAMAIRRALGELGLTCGAFTPLEGVRAARLAPRSFSPMRPLSEVEARLHVIRLLLEAGGEQEAAAEVRERQRRLLAVLSTEGGVRADQLLATVP